MGRGRASSHLLQGRSPLVASQGEGRERQEEGGPRRRGTQGAVSLQGEMERPPCRDLESRCRGARGLGDSFALTDPVALTQAFCTEDLESVCFTSELFHLVVVWLGLVWDGVPGGVPGQEQGLGRLPPAMLGRVLPG